MTNPLRKVAIAGAFVTCVTTAVHAAITATFPAATQIAPPASTLPGALQSNTQVFVFDELQGVTLAGSIPVDITAVGTYNNAASLTPGVLATGTLVDVHLIHFDQLGAGTTTLTGAVSFDGNIIGVQVLSPSLNTADGLGTAGAYPTGNAQRGVEFNGESITVLATNRDIRFTLVTSNVIDQVRVFTRPDEGPPQPKPYVWEFSLDIGSDKELSDPMMDGDEGFDPGDVYLSNEGPVTPPLVPCGRDANFKDDAILFPGDPLPDAPDCAGVTGAPVGSQCGPGCFFEFFDLDAHDQIDVDLRQFIPPTSPLDQPLRQGQLFPFAPANCIFEFKFVLLSYDDDKAENWTFGDVPVVGPSPSGVSSYGSTAARDEIVGWTMSPLGGGFYTVIDSYPAASEDEVHPDLFPNPDAPGDEEDDDVDSLDIVRNDNPDEPDGPIALCPYWTWSPDHEAPSPAALDPGGIYLTFVPAPAAPVKIIDEAIHLGLPESTDIDAFEFAWLPDPQTGALSLAIVFSVDDDDPMTPGDESGGLFPFILYGSFMTGGSFPLMTPGDPAVRDDIDAVTIWCERLGNPTNPCRCPGDLNADGTRDGLDIQMFTDCITSGGAAHPNCDCADINGDGSYDMADVSDFIALLMSKAPCP
ncbi:MAG: hypothetical protein H6819_11870 [Phycisphaerales bacterium]|nr:hypothetical protein [Phycisphaerales bacterium]MCB9854900.1 hypothetical protein [Phycisphaerales bacterium]MCB9864403.1 hypothetical protein [Phycisphaerales bacterium]